MSRIRMMMRTTGLVGGAYLVATRTTWGRRVACRMLRRLTTAMKYQAGRLEGTRYRLGGRHPDPSVAPRVLADRVRSMLGPLEHRLDIPRIHLTVEDHRVVMHGDVSSDDQVGQLMDAVLGIPGVASVQSHLHVGLQPGDSRPSEGAANPGPSRSLATVLHAARSAGVAEDAAPKVVGAVLSLFMAQLPKDERRHVLTHLPADLRNTITLAGSKQVSQPHLHVRRMDDFVTHAGLALDDRNVIESVIGAFRDLVPEEAADVSAVLPRDLRNLWKTAIPA